MQKQKESKKVVVQCRLKIPSLGTNVCSASLVIQNSYSCDRTFNLHWANIKKSVSPYLTDPIKMAPIQKFVFMTWK